jgi:hypothetical protein
MHFDLDDDQKTIQRTARELLTARGGLKLAREGDGAALWTELQGLGWDDPGGAVELAVLMEEVGAVCAPVPLLGAAVAGAAIGTPKLVVDAQLGEAVVLVGDRAFRTTQLEPVETVDATRRFAAPGDAEGDADPALRDRALVALAAELVGIARAALELSVAYAKDREQFGRPIGAYQAVSHRCARMLLDTEAARSLVLWAAWAADHDPEALPRAAAMAKAAASQGALAVCRSAIQVHGGIGFTWEHDLHLLLKRAHLSAELLGGATEHHARVARLAAAA